MPFHQGLRLLFDLGGMHRFAAFDSHRGLDGLGDFLVHAGVDLHRFFPTMTRQCVECRCDEVYQTCCLAV